MEKKIDFQYVKIILYKSLILLVNELPVGLNLSLAVLLSFSGAGLRNHVCKSAETWCHTEALLLLTYL